MVSLLTLLPGFIIFGCAIGTLAQNLTKTITAVSNASAYVFMNSVVLAGPDKFTFNWNITSDSLIGEVKVNITDGWLSFGIAGERGWSYGSDLFVASIDSSGTVEFQDCYVRNGQVFVDRKQNWFILSSAQSTPGYTSIQFQRKLSLCIDDPNEDLDIPNGTPTVLFDWGQLNSVGFIDYPSANWGSMPVPLRNVVTRRGKEESLGQTTIRSFNITDVVLPSDITTFKCRFYTVDNSIVNQQLIKFETILTDENADLVSDWVMYACVPSFTNPNLSDSLTCNSAVGGANPWQSILDNTCNKPIVLWTRGNFLVQEFPYNLGYPMNFKSFVIRIRYDNPEKLSNLNVTIKIKQTFTNGNQQRPYNIGTLVVGVNSTAYGLTIPPGMKDFSIDSYCLASCMNKMISNNSYIYVFATVAHTYNQAKSFETVLVRNNAEIAYIGQNDFYDSQHQYTLFMDSPVIIRQADQLLTTCTFDTTNSSAFLYGGETQTCLNYLYYYPSDPNIDYCLTGRSLNQWGSLLQNLNASGAIFTPQISIKVNDIVSVLSTVNVDNSIQTLFGNFYSTNDNQTFFCGYDNANQISTAFSVDSTLSNAKSICLLNKPSTLKSNEFLLISTVFFLIFQC